MSSLGPNVRTADLNLIAASCAAPPTVYVLSGGIDYDSDDVLGAYSTREMAEEAKRVKIDVSETTRLGRYDRYDIKGVALDAPASHE